MKRLSEIAVTIFSDFLPFVMAAGTIGYLYFQGFPKESLGLLLVPVLFGLFGIELRRRRETAERQELSQSIDVFLKNSVEVVYLGGGEEGFERIIRNLGTCSKFTDVYFQFNPPEKRIYREIDRKRLKEKAQEALRRGAIISLVTNNDSNVHANDILETIGDGKIDGQFNHYQLPNEKTVPFMNFSVFDFSDSLSEVIFGWGHHKFEMDGPKLFLTRNASLVEIFRNLASALQDSENCDVSTKGTCLS